jgi:beta-alanine degradation protein BauB
MKSLLLVTGFVALITLSAAAARAQDPATSDPSHFKVVLENARVRILDITVAPNTKVEVHELDDAVVVPLTNYESKLTTADDKTTTVQRTTGKPEWLPGGGREFEAGSKGVDALLIELKRAPK